MALETKPWDIRGHLRTPEDRAAMLEVLFEDDPSPGDVARMLGHVARAHGMSRLARDTGLTREGLSKALSAEGNPTLATLMAVLRPFGLRLAVTPAPAARDGEELAAA